MADDRSGRVGAYAGKRLPWPALKALKYRDRPADLERIEADVRREVECITVAPRTRELPE